jgi:hypothetical protein
MFETRQRDALLIGLLALLLFGWRAATLPLFDLDEGAFSEATRELLASGDWLMTYLNGEPRYDKPILIYWLQGLSVMALGEREFAFRLPSILCATAWILLIHGFTFDRGSRVAALFASATAALAVMVGVIAHAATADALLNLCIAAALLDIHRWFEQPRRPLLLRIYVWLALGTLTKGPVAVAIPLVVSLLHALWQRRFGDWLRAVLSPAGWLTYIVIVAPWITALSLRDGGEFLDHFLFDHNVGRYTRTLQNHGGRLGYYLLWLPLILLPFSGLLPQALNAAWRDRRDPEVSLLLIWFVVVLLLFSLSSTQLPHYVLYGSTPLFVLFGRICERPRWRFVVLTPALLLPTIIAALPWLLPLIHTPARRAYEAGIIALAQQQFGTHYFVFSVGALAVALVAALPAAISRVALWKPLLVIGLAQVVAVWGALAPALAAAQQAPVRHAALIAKAAGMNAVAYRTDLPSFSVYRGAVTENRLPQPGELVLVRRDRRGELEAALPGVALRERLVEGGIALLEFPDDSESDH